MHKKYNIKFENVHHQYDVLLLSSMATTPFQNKLVSVCGSYFILSSLAVLSSVP